MANVSFRLAKIFAWIALLSIPVMLAGVALLSLLDGGSPASAPHPSIPIFPEALPGRPSGPSATDLGMLAVVGSGLTSLIASIGTASTVLLGWRADRRQSQEFKLKIEQLEFQLVEARKAAPSPKVETSHTAPV